MYKQRKLVQKGSLQEKLKEIYRKIGKLELHAKPNTVDIITSRL